eukprot:gene39242-13505_t
MQKRMKVPQWECACGEMCEAKAMKCTDVTRTELSSQGVTRTELSLRDKRRAATPAAAAAARVTESGEESKEVKSVKIVGKEKRGGKAKTKTVRKAKGKAPGT